MGRRKTVTVEYLHQALIYDVASGSLFWKERPATHFDTARIAKIWNTKYSGKLAGSLDKDGYISLHINGVRFFAHRVIWAMTMRSWPASIVDHKNGIRTDNRLQNLRLVDRFQHAWNARCRKDSKTGLRGVYLRSGRWIARITVGKKTISLGAFPTANAAAMAYEKAAMAAHGEYYRPATITRKGGADG